MYVSAIDSSVCVAVVLFVCLLLPKVDSSMAVSYAVSIVGSILNFSPLFLAVTFSLLLTISTKY